MGRMVRPAPRLPANTGIVMPLSPRVQRLLAPNPSPFTFEGTQTYLVGQHEIAVIDPGPADAAHLDALTIAIGGRAVIAILCTHTHRDHSPAARPLARLTGAPVIGCAPLTVDDDGPRADAAFDPDYVPDRILSDGEAVCGRDWTLTALATPGHTSNHLCYALEEEQALFTGDHVMGWSTSVVSPPDGDMSDYLGSLERLLGRDDRRYFPPMATRSISRSASRAACSATARCAKDRSCACWRASRRSPWPSSSRACMPASIRACRERPDGRFWRI